ncbi:YybH family protein [Aestuariivivens insulae]|uniref:YybH family protein n=1 Tax=Aestuariivivens insulae TaxID=1621988 RepID=UPI001F58286B|nr:nuclear transport factor 2 family protein [Aestuariivivens insulae]
MKLLYSSIFCIFLLVPNQAISQNKTCLKAINTQIWDKFTKAFETLDTNLFASLHSDDLVRVSGNGKTIRNKGAYIKSYKINWKDKVVHQTIAFRFLERICNEETASERGIYKLTRNPNTPNEVCYYGKFHVILKQVNTQWKILVDYDSSENNTINDISFNKAFALDDFEKY